MKFLLKKNYRVFFWILSYIAFLLVVFESRGAYANNDCTSFSGLNKNTAFTTFESINRTNSSTKSCKSYECTQKDLSENNSPKISKANYIASAFPNSEDMQVLIKKLTSIGELILAREQKNVIGKPSTEAAIAAAIGMPSRAAPRAAFTPEKEKVAEQVTKEVAVATNLKRYVSAAALSYGNATNLVEPIPYNFGTLMMQNTSSNFLHNNKGDDTAAKILIHSVSRDVGDSCNQQNNEATKDTLLARVEDISKHEDFTISYDKISPEVNSGDIKDDGERSEFIKVRRTTLNNTNENNTNERRGFLQSLNKAKNLNHTRDLIANITKFVSNFIHNDRLGDLNLGSKVTISSGENKVVKAGIWGKILLNKGQLLFEDNKYNILGIGGALGFDYKVMDNAILGGFLSVSSSDIIHKDNKENLNCALMGLYGKVSLYKDLSIDLVLGGNRAKITNTKTNNNFQDPSLSWFLDFRFKYLIRINNYNKIIPTLGYKINSKQLFKYSHNPVTYKIDEPAYHSFIIGANWMSDAYSSKNFDVTTNVHFFYEQSVTKEKHAINSIFNNALELSSNEIGLSGNDLLNMGFSATTKFFNNNYITLGIDWQHKKDYDNFMFKARFFSNL